MARFMDATDLTEFSSRRARASADAVAPRDFVRPMSCSMHAEQEASRPATAKEQRRADIEGSLAKLLQAHSRHVESMRRQLLIAADAARGGDQSESFKALTIANRHVECDAVVLKAALGEVAGYINRDDA